MRSKSLFAGRCLRNRLFGGSAFAAAFLIALPWSAPAMAQDNGDAGAENASEAREDDRFVITATRRETTEFDAAVGVTALEGSFLTDYGMDEFSDFAGLVPGLDFVEFAPGQTRITIRGVSADPGISTASTVSIYVDDVPVTASDAGQQIDFRMYDLNRVEVLRGPQSTLFGENSMGGAIRFFTNAPDASGFDASYQIGLGGIQSGGLVYSGNAMVNIPLIEDTLAVRAVGSYRNNDGWVDNILTNQDDVNSNMSWAGRIAVQYTPNDDLTINARYNHNHTEIDDLNQTLTDSQDRTNALANSPAEDDYDIYNLDVSWNVGFADIQSVTGYTVRDSAVGLSEAPVSVANANSLLTAFCVFGDPLTGCTTVDPNASLMNSSVFTEESEETVFTQELRLVSPGDQRLRWIIGGFYRDTSTDTENYRVTDPTVVFANDAYLALGYGAGDTVPGGFLAGYGTLESEHVAVFGELSYDITPEVEVTVGARTFEEEFDYLPSTTTGVIAALNSGFTSFMTVSAPFSSSASDTNFRAILSYRPTDTQHYYATYSEGFRSGGANGLATGSPNFQPEYAPDTTQNYEAGAKFILGGGQFELSTAAYYIVWDNLQVNDFDLNTGQGFIRNGGEAHSMGVEAELFGRLTDELSFSLNGNLTEAETDDDIAGSFNPIVPSGTRLPNVPHWSYGATLEYVRPAPNLNADFVARFDVRGQGDTYSAMERYPSTFLGFPLSPKRSLQDGYHIGNVRVGLENENWAATIYVDNVWNEVADLGDNNFGFFHRNQPRTVGVTLFGRF